MGRRVFFSFHYERDIWRVNQVRNSWVTQGQEAAGYWDAGLWEEAKKKGRGAIERMIDDALEGTAVTAVLIGAETSEREYVHYEIKKSYELGKGLLGIRIHHLKDRDGRSDRMGQNPFDKVPLTSVIRLYDWVLDDGYTNFGKWVERAASDAGR